jgi:protein-S-isoprenylcysteine O-methyltransferase Ste14
MGIRMAALGAFFFVPAGTLRWLEAWLLFAIYVTYAVLMTTWLRKHDPALLQERMKGSPVQEGQKGWDRVVMIGFVILGLPLLILPGLDAVRYQWTHMPTALEAMGLAAHVPGLPYRVVRHPMYAAVFLLVFCWPLALGSWLSLIPASLMAVLLVVRTALEDKTLHEELEGYPEYAARTRYRIVPGVW